MKTQGPDVRLFDDVERITTLEAALEEKAAIHQLDYDGMREFQQKFMTADHRLRELEAALVEAQKEWAIRSIVAGTPETKRIVSCASEDEARDWVARFPSSYRLLYRVAVGPWIDAASELSSESVPAGAQEAE